MIEYLNILSNRYQIEWLENQTEGAWGYCYPDRRELQVAKRERMKDFEATTLVHEVFHGIVAEYLRSEEKLGEEEYVSMLSDGFCKVLKDNPYLFEYLKECLKYPDSESPTNN